MERIKEVRVDLSSVAVDDQCLIKDVCAVVAAIREDLVVTDFRISVSGQIYHIVAEFPKGGVVELTKAEMETITDVNPLRVTSVSALFDGSQMCLKVRVCSMDHPITITETALVRVVKKRKWIM